MSKEVRSICADLKANGEDEAAFVLDRVANANAELGEENVDLIKRLEDALWSLTMTIKYMPEGVDRARVIAQIDSIHRYVYGENS